MPLFSFSLFVPPKMQPRMQHLLLRPLPKAWPRPRSTQDSSKRGRLFFHAVAYAVLFSSTLYWSYRTYFKCIRSAMPVPVDFQAILPVIGRSENVDVGATSGYFSPPRQEDEASSIVRRAYERTYAHIVPCDNETLKGLDCWQKTIDYFQPHKRKSSTRKDVPDRSDQSSSNDGSIAPSIPWWFQTFLRDLRYNGAFGQWHELSTANPPIKFCAIEKVGSSAWNDAFCNLNPKSTSVECVHDAELGREECHEEIECSEESPDEEENLRRVHYQRAVFLRDPLERLLSAFINKCYSAIEENHCEPNVIFNSRYQRAEAITDYSGDGDDIITKSLLKDVEDNDKQMFAAYLDIMPLKWNLHVLPQAIYCDLHREYDRYDFVGLMDTDFYFHIENMATKYGEPLATILNQTFDYRQFTASRGVGKHDNIGIHDYYGTQAPAKVRQFYTAHSVRRALEYMSIDYILLGLVIPDWAREILREGWDE